ncbi:MAG: hypothetical protein QGI73_06190 [Candidatus Thalassarchaeaceae archaeon]|nr:hypothetical protein [Candidatus Thalassarchaeaceae archaeon]
MSRRESSALVWGRCEELLREYVESSFSTSPLPNPPLELPDFPAIQPTSSDSLVQQAVGLYAIDRAGFNQRLSAIVESTLPDYVNRNIDPDSTREKWMAKNTQDISERVISQMAWDWLSSALDEDSPDTDRWYLAVSLLIGFSLSGSDVARRDGFHLLTSIAMAKPPGSWSSELTGPHQMAWNPAVQAHHDNSPHPSGVMAAAAILDSMAMGASSQTEILPHWLEGLTVKGQLCNLLNVPNRLMASLERDSGKHTGVLVRGAVQLMAGWPGESRDILLAASQHDDQGARRELSSSLQRISSEDRSFALHLMDILLEDDDSDVRTLATTYLSSLVRTDFPLFAEKASAVLEKGDSRMTQRIVDSAMREYISMDSEDGSGLLPMAWMSSNESSRSRLTGLMIQQAEVSKRGFMKTTRIIKDRDGEAYADLKERVLRRDVSLSDEMDD